MRLVNRLLLTTVVYSSGPVTPLMRNAVLALAEEAELGPHPRGLDQELDAVSEQKSVVAGGRDVLAEGVGDVGVDVVLRGAGRVVRGRLVAVDRAPREQGAALADLARPAAGLVEHPQRELEQRCARRRGVGQERQHVDLGVPEVVAFVAGAGQALGRDAVTFAAQRWPAGA